MALSILLLLLGIWLLVNTFNGNLGGVLSGTVKIGPAS